MNHNTPKLIAYYDRDDHGSDGWWEEGDARDEIGRHDLIGIIVEVAKLGDLSTCEWDSLHRQWRFAHRNGWTSSEVDAAIRLEHDRRSE